MTDRLQILAGSEALATIRDEGLNPERVRVMAGAAGGPKWLVLYHMDRLLISEFFKDLQASVYLIGASSGAWRFAGWCRKDPLAALARFRDAYTQQIYITKPTPQEVTDEGLRILSVYMGQENVKEVLASPRFHAGILTVRARYLAASENPALRAAGLYAIMAQNLISRKLIGLSLERVVFHDHRQDPPFTGSDGIPTRRVHLSPANFRDALLASGSIPMVMKGVHNIPGAPRGVYLDGGVVDYHIDLPFDLDSRSIVLMPHYIDRIIPGWLDKKLKWRKPVYGKNTLLVAPSPAFVKSLPGEKIPDRTDFNTYFGRDKERIAIWKKATEACRRLGEEFMELVASGNIRDVVQPMAKGADSRGR
jgi:hypothetical protein